MKYKKAILTILLLAAMVANGQTIRITGYPVFGEQSLLAGQADVVNPSAWSVACYLFVQEGGGWWGPKPSTIQPVTPLQPDGSFALNFISGGYDHYCTGFFVCLWPNSNPAPPFNGGGDLPAALLNQPHDLVERPHGSKQLFWPRPTDGWVIKETFNDIPIGPGENLFSSSPENVWIDSQNRLHLKITYQNGKYRCSEVIADTSMGYGKYYFVYENNPNILDIRTVFGFFTWDSFSPLAPEPENFYREIDFEFSRWGNANDPTNAQFVIQPWQPPGNLLRYNAGTSSGTIHSFAWYKDSVVFESRKADSTMIKKWVYTGSDNPKPGNENIRINLWLTSQSPAVQDEVILSDYGFRHLLEAPAQVGASKCAGNSVEITWDAMSGCYYQVSRSDNPQFGNPTPIHTGWIAGNSFTDESPEPEKWYWYAVRCADNPSGSNINGYISGYSSADSGIVCQSQQVMIPAGWSAISGYIAPVETSIDSLFDFMGDDLVIIKNDYGIYYPANGIYTLTNWNYQDGYIIKANAPASLDLQGFSEIDRTLYLHTGWNILPVLSPCTVSCEMLFSSTSVVIIKEIAGIKCWWPEMNISTLTNLNPGSSYYVFMNGNNSITFPTCSFSDN